jgi:hypothetical protein
MSKTLMTAFSILEPVLLVVILAVALRQVAKRLTTISQGLSTLAGALATVESQHLNPLATLVADVNRRLQVISNVLPGIAAKAALVVRKARGA